MSKARGRFDWETCLAELLRWREEMNRSYYSGEYESKEHRRDFARLAQSPQIRKLLASLPADYPAQDAMFRAGGIINFLLGIPKVHRDSPRTLANAPQLRLDRQKIALRNLEGIERLIGRGPDIESVRTRIQIGLPYTDHDRAAMGLDPRNLGRKGKATDARRFDLWMARELAEYVPKQTHNRVAAILGLLSLVGIKGLDNPSVATALRRKRL